MRQPRSTRFMHALASLVIGVVAAPARASDDPLADLLQEPGSAGLGFIVRMEASPYRNGGTRTDLLPLYLYEGERFFLRSNRAGVLAWSDDAQRLELFVGRRLEGFPEDERPASLQGMLVRNTGADVGIRYAYRRGPGTWDATLLQDIAGVSDGTELRTSYSHVWRHERWAVQPGVALAWRSARLNDYYFGVPASESAVQRPAYRAGAGIDATLSLNASYRIFQRWRLLGGVSATWLSGEIRDSPVVRDRLQPALSLGAVYDFGNGQVSWDDAPTPYSLKLFHGRAAEDGCHLARIMTFKCASLNDEQRTDIAGLQLGCPFIERLHGWPLDVVGYVGVVHHDERGIQRNGWQLDAFMKGYYYGFPWRERVTTRVGFGFGVSYAERVPYTEVESQARRGRNTSKLLNYLEPSIDFSVGDVFGMPRWEQTFFGVAVSHRSGIFATSELLGTVDGGSNYLYVYLEMPLGNPR